MTFASLCIPRMECKYDINFVRKILENSHIGNIVNIVEVPNKSNEKYKKVIINIDLTDVNEIINRRFSENKDIKIIYDNPFYWKIYKTK